MGGDIERPLLPEGSVVNGEILITSYFDPLGQMKYSVGSTGNLNIAQILGLLVLGGVSIFQSYKMNEPYDPDDDDDEEEENGE